MQGKSLYRSCTTAVQSGCVVLALWLHLSLVGKTLSGYKVTPWKWGSCLVRAAQVGLWTACCDTHTQIAPLQMLLSGPSQQGGFVPEKCFTPCLVRQTWQVAGSVGPVLPLGC